MQRHIQRVCVNMKLLLRETKRTFNQYGQIPDALFRERAAGAQISASPLLGQIARKLFRRQACDAPLAKLRKNVKVNNGFIASVCGRLHIRMT